ncbi:MAG: redox-sensitive transcriptional activator SoxR [Proteobacteria bacterium]|nr:redox-sensitive transcriptional activator SoxR [Pseudomonadota bacterium]
MSGPEVVTKSSSRIPALLGVGAVARRAGVKISTLHFYEAEGLIVSERSRGNQRRFRRDVLRRIAVIRIAQAVGIPLGEIRARLAELPGGQTPDARDWARMSAAWRENLDARIAALHQLRDQLQSCIGCGCLSVDRCALYNPQDRLSAKGQGPRLLIVPEVPGQVSSKPGRTPGRD